MKTGVELIAKERQRQVEQEDWDADHDATHTKGELAIAGSLYAMPHEERRYKPVGAQIPKKWPWDWKWWKPTQSNRIKELVKAGALIAAEIDRLQSITQC